MTDVSFGLRMLRRNPGFTLVVITLLAIGSGASTLIFSAFDSVMFRPLPVRQPDQLVHMIQQVPRIGKVNNFHYSYYRALRDHSTMLSQVFGETALDVVMSEPQPAEQVRVNLSTADFFEALGVAPLYGRVLSSSDATEDSGAPPAVLSYSFWQRRFNGDPHVIGATITLHDHRFTIVGVMPREFNGISVDTAPDVRVPHRAISLFAGPSEDLQEESSYLDLGGRLKPGVSLARAQAECVALWRADTERYAATPRGIEDELRFGMELEPLTRGVSVLRERYGPALKLLLASVTLLLLMVCVNVSGLLLARSAARRGEIAVRLAVGATRGRLVRQLLVESSLLSMLGVIGGLFIVSGATRALMRALPPVRDVATRRLTLSLDLGVDSRVLLFSLAISVMAVLLFGLAPAVAASRASVEGILRTAKSHRSSRGRQLLIGFQIALCTLLLTGAGLLVQTFRKLSEVDPGFDRDHVVTFTVDPSLSGYTPAQEHTLVQNLVERVRNLPGVAAVSIASRGVMRGRGLGMTIAPAGQQISQADFVNASANQVSPGYFDSMGMRIHAGRDFMATDEQTMKPAKVVVNEAFAMRFFHNANPIGKHIGAGRPGQVAAPMFEIIGVVSDTKYRSLREPVGPIVYTPLNGIPPYVFLFVLHVRTIGRPESIIPPVQQTLTALDPGLPITEVHTLADEVEASTAGERLTASLASLFAALAAFLATVGIYGLLTYAVAQRQREIGIRMALGARSIHVVSLIGRQAAAIVGAGIMVGLVSAAMVGSWIRSLLYGVTSFDLESYGAAAVFVALVSMVAVSVPLARAVKIDPAAALRIDN